MGLRFLLNAGVACPLPVLARCRLQDHQKLGAKNDPVVELCLLVITEGETMKKKITTAVFFALLMVATGSVQARADMPVPVPIPGAR